MPSFASLLRLSFTLFVATTFFYVLFYSINGAQPNSRAFYIVTFSLAALSVATALGGIVSLVRYGHPDFGKWSAAEASLSAISGLALTFLTAPYPPYGIFEITYTGFPLPFESTTYIPFQSFTSTYPLSFMIDCAFWICLVYLGVSFAGSAVRHQLKMLGIASAASLSSFLTFGTYPVWAIASSWGAFAPVLNALGTTIVPVIFFGADGAIGLLLVVEGYKRLGLLVMIFGLVFDSLLGFAILAASQHFIL